MAEFPFPDCGTWISGDSHGDYGTAIRTSVFGGDDDLWGAESAEMLDVLNDNDFTVVFSVEPTESTTGTITVHDIEVRVYYDFGDEPAAVPSLRPSVGLTDVVIGEPYTVAVGAAGRLFRSADLGATWAACDSPTSDDLLAVTYGRGVYVAVGRNGAVVLSEDGEDWTLYRHPHGTELTSVVLFESEYHEGTISGGAEGPVTVSSDWRLILGGRILHMLDLDEFLATGSFVRTQTSATGQTYDAYRGRMEDFDVQVENPVLAMARSPFNMGRRYLYGDNAITRVFNDQELVLVNPDGEVSNRLVRENLANNLGYQVRESSGALHAVAASDETIIAVGESGLMFKSRPCNEIITTITVNGSPVQGPDVPGGACDFDSSSAAAHGDVTIAGGTTFYGLAYGAGVYLAVGAGGAMYASEDEGLNWAPVASGTTEALRGVDVRDGAYVAVGDNDTVVYGIVEDTDLQPEVTDRLQVVAEGGVPQVHALSVADALAGLSSTADDESGIEHFGGVSDLVWTDGYAIGAMVSQRLSSEIADILDRPILNDEVLGDTVSFVEALQDFIAQVYSDTVAEVLGLSMEAADFLAGQYLETVAEALALSSAETWSWSLLVQDAAAFAADAYVKLAVALERADTIEVEADLAGTLVLVETVAEDAGFGETPRSNAVLQRGVGEMVQFGVALILRGASGSDAYTGWCMNTRTFAVTTYGNFDFTSMIEMGGTLVGANEEGLFELSGGDDAGIPIPAHIRTGALDFDTSREKRVTEAWIGSRRDGELVLKTVTNRQVERWYSLKRRKAGLNDQRVTMHKGVRANYWEFELHNVEGSDFELDHIRLTPLILKRRGR